MRLLLVAASVLLATPSSMAQVASGPEKICADPATANVAPPSAGDASKDVTPASATTGQAADNSAVCAVAPDGQGAPSTASASLAATIAEAERRVANLKFEVGPPPRNLTKGASSTPGPVS